MTVNVNDVIAEVRMQSRGRTRYEGQEPYHDELLVAEIDRLRGENERLWGIRDAVDDILVNSLNKRLPASADDNDTIRLITELCQRENTIATDPKVNGGKVLVPESKYNSVREKNEQLQEECDRLTYLLADALRHCPASYRDPIMAVLRSKQAANAVEEEQA